MDRYRKRQNGNIENGEKGELMNEYRMNEEEREKEDGSVRERALIIGVRTQEDTAFDTSMRELESLAEACEMEVAARIEQSLSTPTSAYYIGSGKVKEVQETVELLDIAYVIFEGTLSPSQLKNLQKEIDAQVMDRTNLILEIFSRRARTREARLQVELASLQYMLPRLVGMRENLGRQAGASGSMSNKGTGEKQIELDRRKIEKRISDLGRELEAIEHDRDVQRKKRGRSALPQVALVGYTNAGKSTLMNWMLEACAGKEGPASKEEKKVMAKDMLFATLDTTVRKIQPQDGRAFLLSDTVGFVSKLPHDLVKAFRSTLDEVRYADLLLNVVDASDEQWKEQLQVTMETLRELGAETLPCIHVMNKAERILPLSGLPRVEEERIYLSAKEGIGLDALLLKISQALFAKDRKAAFLIPYNRGDIVHYFNENAVILEQSYLPEGVRLMVECRQADYDKYEAFLSGEI